MGRKLKWRQKITLLLLFLLLLFLRVYSGLEPIELEISNFLDPGTAMSMCLLVITLLFYLYRFPGKKTQDMDIESKFVTAAKRSRKETTVEEILGESFIK